MNKIISLVLGFVFGVTLLLIGGFIGSNYYPKVDSEKRFTDPVFIEVTGRKSLTQDEIDIMTLTLSYAYKKAKPLHDFHTELENCISLPEPKPCLVALRDKSADQ